MATSKNLKVDTFSISKPEPPSAAAAAVVSRLSSPATPAKSKALAAAATVAASPASTVNSSIAQKSKPSPASSIQGISVGLKANEKQVRFGSRSVDTESTTSAVATQRAQQAQHRYVSPARSVASHNTGTPGSAQTSSSVLEYQTYRSPDRTVPEAKRGGGAGEETEVPSLCSAYSSAMVSTSSVVSTAGSESAVTSKFKAAPASSISVDHSDASAASPLGQASQADDSSYRQDNATVSQKGHNRINSGDMGSLTSRVSGQKGTQSLDSLAKASAEMAAKSNAERRYLPPSPPKSSFLRDIADEKKGGDEDLAADSEMELHSKKDDTAPQSPRNRDEVSTPTDFAVDYCKTSTTTFDSSNVLAWLQSPTAHGLFSPGGGLGSLMNTPAGGGAPRSPHTPTISTSFFFADVASLPKTDSTPNRSDGGKKPKGSTICISPLASTRPRPSGVLSAGTPLDFKDIFASPKERKSLPLLGETPSKADRQSGANARKGGKSDPSIDAVHLAERDLLEDEDLNVLMQLASNTPASKHGGGDSAGAVFRSPAPKEGENFPGLELPMIGNDVDQKGGVKAKLQQKPEGKSAMEGEAYGPPQLGMRSSSSVGSATAQPNELKGEAAKEAEKMSGLAKDSDLDAVASGGLRTTGSGSLANANPYPVAPYSVPTDMQAYYPMTGVPAVPPNSSGSMRVVMGGPPPRRNNNSNNNGKPGVSPTRQGSSPFHEGFPAPQGNLPYPPPPGMFSSSFPYNGMNRYPPYTHYPPPPRQMPMYNSQHPNSGSNTTATAAAVPATTAKTTIKTTTKETKKTKAAKAASTPKAAAGAKRSAPAMPTPSTLDRKAPPQPTLPGATTATSSPAKRQKKSPGPKKKNRSPALYGAERDKTASAIHAVNKASGAQNDKAAALAAAILRGVTMRPSGKWQAQLYFAGKSRYIGVFDTREKAALAYEIAREKLKTGSSEGGLSTKQTENLVNAARKAAFDGVNERLPK